MNMTATFLLQNQDENEAFSEKVKSADFVSYFTSQRLLNDITMENYLATNFVHTDFSVSTLLYGYLLAEQFYYIFWVVVIIISYIVLFIMSANTNTTTRNENEGHSRLGRLRLWNPRPSDDSDNDIQPPQVVNEEPLNDEVYLPEDRPQVNIKNAIRHEDLPQCRPLSKCNDIHPADPVIYDLKDHGQNYRQRIFHEKWSEQETKIFANKYSNLQSNKERKFELMAKALSGKTSVDCRQFYYLYKHILDFKTPERERKQIEKERKESLLRLKEPCSSRLRSGRNQESHAKSRDTATPCKKYSIVKTQTNRPVFVRNDGKTQKQDTELTKDLQITEESITASLSSIPFTASLQENDLPNLSTLTNLNLLADVCSKKTEIQMLSKQGQKEQKEQKKERKRSHEEANIDEKTSAEKDCKKTSKKRCLDNLVKPAKKAAKVVKVQEKLPVKENGKKRKRQEIIADDLVLGQKKTRTGRAIKPPTKMDL